MGLFTGKRGIIFGVANKDSIAWGIAQALHEAQDRLEAKYADYLARRNIRLPARELGVKGAAR